MTVAASGRFWLITLAALLVAGTTLGLGAWQWDRAAQKLALRAAIDRNEAMPPVRQEVFAAGARAQEQLLHREVVLRGNWVAQHTVFLDNRQMQGKPGFYVITPLKLDDATAVLVERGWVHRNFVDRTKLPRIDTPAGPVELRGRIAPLPAKLYEFAGAQPGRIRQNLDLAQFRAETGLALLDLAVRQTQGAPDGLLRDWPELASGAERNYGYAFQWWAMSALVAFLYVWFQFIAPRRGVPDA